MQLAPRGIGVSCLFPGATRTALVPLPEDDPSIDAGERTAIPQGLCGTPCAARSTRSTPAARWWTRSRRTASTSSPTSEFLDEVKERHREIEAAFPTDDPTPGRVKFETMRAEQVKNLMAPGNRPVPREGEPDFALDLGSKSPAGGQ